jgi:hypothetical protein
MRTLKWDVIQVLVFAACIGIRIADCQISHHLATADPAGGSSMDPVCEKPTLNPAARAALRLVCRNTAAARRNSSTTNTIILGFVGGFANPRDEKHPEVLFGEYLREHYAEAMEAGVFSNRDEAGALRFVMRALTGDSGGAATNEERKKARIILYGHSWGASEAVAFAHELGRRGIPVQLTIQVDIIAKPSQNPVLIPDNVQRAVNFYQAKGVLHGRPTVVASDPDRTEIIGNFKRIYPKPPPDCKNYSWFVRTFNKPHHEIENDPEVWGAAALLVDTEISAGDQFQALASSGSSVNSLPRQTPFNSREFQAMSAEDQRNH